MAKKGAALPPPPCRRRSDDEVFQIHPVSSSVENGVVSASLGHVSSENDKSNKEVEELEKEMWERFYGTGFWRSPSQRELPPSFTATT